MVIVSLFSGDCNTVLPHRNRKNHTPFSRIKKNTQDLKQNAIFSVIYFRCKLAGVRLLFFTAGIKKLILLPKNRTQVKDRVGVPRIRFHDLRHPYVKHTTKIFSLRLMDFQAQAYPDARRKTRGACQLLRVGQSRSPVRPLCNRKRFSCLPPQSKMSWILYAISMRLSGYTSTRSISSSASSVVSVSASKIALDAFLRLSCRACSSCFCFACANTAA